MVRALAVGGAGAYRVRKGVTRHYILMHWLNCARQKQCHEHSNAFPCSSIPLLMHAGFYLPLAFMHIAYKMPCEWIPIRSAFARFV
jgi:hypothetical protein